MIHAVLVAATLVVPVQDYETYLPPCHAYGNCRPGDYDVIRPQKPPTNSYYLWPYRPPLYRGYTPNAPRRWGYTGRYIPRRQLRPEYEYER